MYNLNELGRNVMITPQEVIFHAPTKQTLDPRTILQSIIIAEERFLRVALGYEFYQVLCQQKNRIVTESNLAELQEYFTKITLQVGQRVNSPEFLNSENKELWNYILWKYTSECVMITAFPEGFVQFAAEGIVHGAPPAGPMTTNGAVTPELRSVKWMMDKKMSDRIDPLKSAMHEFICMAKKSNPQSYPNYTAFCDCNEDGVPFKRKTDIILDMYDDDNDCRCR